MTADKCYCLKLNHELCLCVKTGMECAAVDTCYCLNANHEIRHCA